MKLAAHLKHTRTHTTNSPYECMKGRHAFELWRHERHTVAAACKQRCPSWVYTLPVSTHTHTSCHSTHTLYRLISTVSVVLVSIQLHSISNPRTHLRKRTVEVRCTSSDLSSPHPQNQLAPSYIHTCKGAMRSQTLSDMASASILGP